MSIIPQKRCSKCGAEKPLSEFYKDRHASDGLTHSCQVCQRAMARRWQERNAEHRTAYGKQWRETNRQYDKERKAQWYVTRAEQERERARRYRQEHPDQVRAAIKAYRKAKPEKIHTIQQRRRARKYQQGGSYTEQQWVSLKHQYNCTCLRCGRSEPDIRLTADHVIPISRGGSSYIENIQPLCDDCNRWKNAKTIDFRQEGRVV